MTVVEDILYNKMIIVPVICWIIAQVMKTGLHIIKYRTLDFERLVGAGGMPSAHSALVTSLAVSVGTHEGFRSTYFAIALIFALVVMYDACGVRRAAGQQASIINKMVFDKNHKYDLKDPLKELLGHTPFEVVAGALLGIFVTVLYFTTMP